MKRKEARMDRVVSLNARDLDWELLAQTVERAGRPLWLELGGLIRGVLLPTDTARRLMGQYVQAHTDLALISGELRAEPEHDPPWRT
jgi:hypothetical protein